MQLEPGQRLVLYDGQCPFCVGWIKFLLDRDGDNRLRFAQLQSEWTERFFAAAGMGRPVIDSVLVWDGETLLHSSAALASIAEVLPGIWHFGKHLTALPESLRNDAYRLVADRRHRLFGRYPKCWVPKPEDRAKFLDLKDKSGQHRGHGTEAGIDPDPHKQ